MQLHQFEYDPFQKQAIDAIDGAHSVFVSAPTGCGKTAIAEYAINQCLTKNLRAVYTAPIKAISNQKYRDFSKSFPGQVGLLTGDVAIEPNAPVLIMTTEIYRNQLFESDKSHLQTEWAIFDEVHYLDDYERGTVWEEALMFTRPNTKILALSATVPNAEDLAKWIESVHQQKMIVVKESVRPVELEHRYQCRNKVYTSLDQLKKQGFKGLDIWKRQSQNFHRRRRPNFRHGSLNTLTAEPNNTNDLIQHVIDEKELPCLYFAFGRKRVEELAKSHTHFELLNASECRQNKIRFEEIQKKLSLSDQDSNVSLMKNLVSRGIAYHHAGLLPTLKETVEQLFTEKRIKLIFTTETFALGINMPARTVIFDELRKFYGFGFDDLTTRDYYQMAGRAGRRGIDTVGYVYSRVNPHFIAHHTVQKIVTSPNECVNSQFNASYATILNLYRRYGMDLLNIYPKTFHYWQSNAKKQKRAVGNIERKLIMLKKMKYIDSNDITEKGEFAMWMYGYEMILSELWSQGHLEKLDAIELGVLLTALVFEPRKTDRPVTVPKRFRHLAKLAVETAIDIRTEELNAHIAQQTRLPSFNLSRAIEAWMEGMPFHELSKFTDNEAGIIVRYFRMTIQLLRQLDHDSRSGKGLRKVIHEAFVKINRDIVDAEKLLRNDTPDPEEETDSTEETEKA